MEKLLGDSKLMPSLRHRVMLALTEDLSITGDVTTNAVFPEASRGVARIKAKGEGIISGGVIVQLVFEELGGVEVRQLIADKQRVKPGDVVFELSGRIRSMLSGERTALDFLMHLSGIATLTRQFVDAVGDRIQICDTRKTMPLWRDLEKYGVRCGGGINHRMGLYDMVMLKDTHADGAGSLSAAIQRVKPLQPRLKIAAEARTLDEVRMAVDGEVDLIMLDNMSDEELRAAVELINGRVTTEVTGGITIDRAAQLAEVGIDRISVGALTHSVRALDFSMRLEIDSKAEPKEATPDYTPTWDI